METTKNAVLFVMAAAGSAIAQALGGWDAGLQVLVAMMVADYITGLLVAGLWHTSTKTAGGGLSSEICFKGLIKKGAILALVLIGVMLDRALELAYIRTTIIFFFIGNEGISLLENLGLMGVPFPSFLETMLEVLKENNDKGGEGRE